MAESIVVGGEIRHLGPMLARIRTSEGSSEIVAAISPLARQREKVLRSCVVSAIPGVIKPPIAIEIPFCCYPEAPE